MRGGVRRSVFPAMGGRRALVYTVPRREPMITLPRAQSVWGWCPFSPALDTAFCDTRRGSPRCGKGVRKGALACDPPASERAGAMISGPLSTRGVAGLGMHLALRAVQQPHGLGDVGHVRRGDGDGAHRLAVPVRSDVRFHSKIPLVALLGLVHPGIALLAGVLGRGGRGDERGVHPRAFAQHQAALGEVGVDRHEEGLAQVVCFQQAAKLEQRGGGARTLPPRRVRYARSSATPGCRGGASSASSASPYHC
jgi:hypothetical protein